MRKETVSSSFNAICGARARLYDDGGESHNHMTHMAR